MTPGSYIEAYEWSYNTVQQILDDWMLQLTEYTICMYFGPQNTKMTLKFIG